MSKTQKSKSILFISDFHCGSAVGLTPPQWQYKKLKTDVSKHNKFADLQNIGWDWFSKQVKSLGIIDLCVIVGDCIDGQGMKDNGVGKITTDMNEQVQMAIDVLQYVNAKKYLFISGSGYHTDAAGNDFEQIIASNFRSKIGIHEFVDVNGLIFNCKHKVGRSSIPHGRSTPLQKAKLWEIMWNHYHKFPTSDVIVRGHVHYHEFTGNPDCLIMTLPCLKMVGEKWGSKNYDDTIHYGFVHFNVKSSCDYDWKAHTLKLDFVKPQVLHY